MFGLHINNTVSGNNVDDKKLVYLERLNSYLITGSVSEIIIVRSSIITISHIGISNIDIAVELWEKPVCFEVPMMALSIRSLIAGKRFLVIIFFYLSLLD